VFSKIFIVGLGLIGGSLAADIRSHGIARQIIGYDNNKDNLETAEKLGLIDKPSTLKEGACCELIILSVPVSQIPQVYEKISPYLGRKSIVIDTGSVKGYVIKQITNIKNSERFVPCHPIAGTENNGPAAAKRGLFKGKNVIITSDRGNESVQKIAKFWRLVGANVVFMNANKHDEIFATVSHLPHFVAYSLVDSVLVDGNLPEYIGGGLADYTRIAASSPAMWSDIFIYNKQNLLKAVGKYESSLKRLKNCIIAGNGVTRFLSAVQKAKLASKKNAQIIIAVDGPSGVGKSSIAQHIANELNFFYIDSGALYRALAVIDRFDESKLEFIRQDGKWLLCYNGSNIENNIRTEKAAAAASKIAREIKTREKVNNIIYSMVGENSAVVEGRDAGTAIFPNADLKLFLDAPLVLRAERRMKDDKAATAQQINARDRQDKSRAISPLRAASDAIYLDTSASYDTVVRMVDSVIRNVLKISIS